MNSGHQCGNDVLAEVLRASGAPTGTRHAILRRGGRVLLALPGDRETAARTLQLYQPQKSAAKVIAGALKFAVDLGLHQLLLPSHVTGNAVSDRPTPIPVGVLVGSSGHLCERAVIVSCRAGTWEVAKFARGTDAWRILSNEASMLKLFDTDPRVPELISLETSEDGVMLRMNWMEGQPWEGAAFEPILELLDDWRRPVEWRALGDMPEWSWIEKGFSMANSGGVILERMREHRVPVSIRHGDLTRPNLRVRNDGRLIVHDWERGAAEGAAALDLAHFAIQDVLFRENHGHREAVSTIRRRLSAEPAEDWLAANGWGGKMDFLLAANLALNTGAGYLDQRDLLLELVRAGGFGV